MEQYSWYWFNFFYSQQFSYLFLFIAFVLTQKTLQSSFFLFLLLSTVFGRTGNFFFSKFRQLFLQTYVTKIESPLLDTLVNYCPSPAILCVSMVWHMLTVMAVLMEGMSSIAHQPLKAYLHNHNASTPRPPNLAGW